jgi:DivIVA domain-containing protein
MTMAQKNIEDDPEAMSLVMKLHQRGYKADEVRRYMDQVELAANPLSATERRWFDPNEPRWVTK